MSAARAADLGSMPARASPAGPSVPVAPSPEHVLAGNVRQDARAEGNDGGLAEGDQSADDKPAALDEETSAPLRADGIPESESVNVWPDETAEAAFMSEARGRGEVVVPVAAETIAEVEEKAKALPKLDDLVSRIPSETRELLEELFRAKFTAVRRVKKTDLKN